MEKREVRGGLPAGLRERGQARVSLGRYLDFYNTHRPHSAHGGRTPDQAYASALPIPAKAA